MTPLEAARALIQKDYFMVEYEDSADECTVCESEYLHDPECPAVLMPAIAAVLEAAEWVTQVGAGNEMEDAVKALAVALKGEASA